MKITRKNAYTIVVITVVIIAGISQYYANQEESEALYAQHPVTYLEKAADHLNNGNMDKAVFWYYVGQIRFRFHLMANPDLEPSGDPIVYSTMEFLVGEPIKQYASGNPDNWIALIKQAQEWDQSRPNQFTSKQQYALEYQEILGNMDKMIHDIDNNRQQIK